jgi:hypothetical protein
MLRRTNVKTMRKNMERDSGINNLLYKQYEVAISDDKELSNKMNINLKPTFKEINQSVKYTSGAATRGMFALSTLGVDGLAGPLNAVAVAVNITLAGKGAMSLMKSAALAETAIQQTLATAETAFVVATGNIVALTAASASALAVYSAFQYSTGEWNFDKDWKSLAGNRDIKNTISEVM